MVNTLLIALIWLGFSAMLVGVVYTHVRIMHNFQWLRRQNAFVVGLTMPLFWPYWLWSVTRK